MYFLVLYSMSLNTALYSCVFVCLGVQGGAPSGGFWPGRGPPAWASARAAGGQTALLCWGVRLPSGKSFYLFIYPSLPWKGLFLLYYIKNMFYSIFHTSLLMCFIGNWSNIFFLFFSLSLLSLHPLRVSRFCVTWLMASLAWGQRSQRCCRTLIAAEAS